jgi:hypothetical protein
MRAHFLRCLFLLLLGLLPGIAQARLFKVVTPEQLLPISSVICNGTVLKLEKMGEPQQSGTAPKFECTSWKAHIKLLSAYKGQLPAEFDLYYTEKFFPMDGPIGFKLLESNRYRFYLNPAPDGRGYNVALENDTDNLWSVEPLLANTPDNAPPIFEEEARKLALAYYQEHKPAQIGDHPDIQVRRSLTGTEWEVAMSFDAHHNYTTPDVRIIILNDRTVSPRSWVAVGPSLSPDEMTSRDIGRSCLVRVVETSPDRTYGNSDLYGTVSGLTATELILSEAASVSGSYDWKTLKVARKDIDRIQFLSARK